MRIERIWAMPHSDTFKIKPVRDLIEEEISAYHLSGINAVYGVGVPVIIDPFARNSPFKDRCHATNDLNMDCDTTHHLEAMEFLKLFEDNSTDIVLFDPPWTARQISECYKSIGKKVHMEDTQSSFYTHRKKEVARILKPGGLVICCGYTSGGLGKNLGFDLERVLLVPHGGAHYDSIITVERKKPCLFD